MSPSTSSRRMRAGALRTVTAFALVPLTAPVMAIPVYTLLSAAGLIQRGAPLNSLDALLGFGAGVGLLALVVTCLCAIPAVAWLSERRRLSLESILTLGALLGNVPFAAIVLIVSIVAIVKGAPLADVGQYWYGLAGAIVRILMGAAIGMTSAAVLWFVGIADNDSWQVADR